MSFRLLQLAISVVAILGGLWLGTTSDKLDERRHGGIRSFLLSAAVISIVMGAIGAIYSVVRIVLIAIEAAAR